MRKITKRSAAVITAAVVAVGGAGAAYAAWSLSGKGSAQAKAATVQPLEASAVQVEGLSPGNSSDLQFTVFNTNKFSVKITSVTLGDITGTDPCPAGNVSKPTFTLPSDLVVGPAGATASQKVITLPKAIAMNLTAGDNCQGAVFSVPLTFQAISVAG